MSTRQVLSLDATLGFLDSLTDTVAVLRKAGRRRVVDACDAILMLIAGTPERHARTVEFLDDGTWVWAETDEIAQHAKPGLRRLAVTLYRLDTSSLDGYPTTSGGERSGQSNELGEVWDARGEPVLDATGKQLLAPLPARPNDPTARVAIARIDGADHDHVHETIIEIGTAARKAAHTVHTAPAEYVIDRLEHAARVLAAAESKAMRCQPAPPPPARAPDGCTSCARWGIDSWAGDEKQHAQRLKRLGQRRFRPFECEFCEAFFAKHGRRPSKVLCKKHDAGERIYDRDVRASLGRSA